MELYVMVSTVTLSIVLAFACRLRGGGFVQLHDVEYRFLWGSALALAYIFMNFSHPDMAYALMILPLAYVSMLIPHGFCQNLGRWPTPQRKWPAFFLPTLTNEEWTGAGMFLRTVYDFLSMMGVGLFRGMVMFLPYLATQYAFHAKIDLHGVIAAVLTLSVGQAVAYLAGWYCPLNFPSLAKRSTEWCEFGNGLVWGVALSML